MAASWPSTKELRACGGERGSKGSQCSEKGLVEKVRWVGIHDLALNPSAVTGILAAA